MAWSVVFVVAVADLTAAPTVMSRPSFSEGYTAATTALAAAIIAATSRQSKHSPPYRDTRVRIRCYRRWRLLLDGRGLRFGCPQRFGDGITSSLIGSEGTSEKQGHTHAAK